ncbi:creatininase family protein [Paenibacillus koleovorans]|uniref:creatininase family protein n=1 Tax=Paenibacillus koleovorans TaxID=121608 RepID=UPI0013E34D80|nr:creatininase family protein [Paenibacillus koleovorans]
MVAVTSYLYEKLTWEEINVAIRENRVILIPIGSTEQHGRHLPMEVDNFLARQVCLGAAEKIPDQVLVMPNVNYGFNTHVMDFPGQITVNGSTFIQYVLSVTKSLAYHGFRRIILVNGHGSNMPFLDIAARQTILETKGKTQCMALIHTNLATDVAGEIRESEIGGMAHACEWETSMYLHLAEQEVRKDKLQDEIHPKTEFIWSDIQKKSPVLYTPWTSSVTESGVSGAAKVSTKEKGKILYETEVERLARLVIEFKARPDYPRRDQHEQPVDVDLESLLGF